MSLKENVERVKEELSSEEKFFEKAVVTERFVKKYKKPLIGVLVAVVFVALANVAYDVKEQNRIQEANRYLAVLLRDKNDVQAREALKKQSPKLYELWSLATAIETGDTKKLQSLRKTKLPLIGDIASYEIAQHDRDLEALEAYQMRQNALYKDLAAAQSALILLQKNDIAKAQEKLSLISSASPLNGVVKILRHYGVK